MSGSRKRKLNFANDQSYQAIENSANDQAYQTIASELYKSKNLLGIVEEALRYAEQKAIEEEITKLKYQLSMAQDKLNHAQQQLTLAEAREIRVLAANMNPGNNPFLFNSPRPAAQPAQSAAQPKSGLGRFMRKNT